MVQRLSVSCAEPGIAVEVFDGLVEGMGRSCIKAANFTYLFLLRIRSAVSVGDRRRKEENVQCWLQPKCVFSPSPANFKL